MLLSFKMDATEWHQFNPGCYLLRVSAILWFVMELAIITKKKKKKTESFGFKSLKTGLRTWMISATALSSLYVPMRCIMFSSVVLPCTCLYIHVEVLALKGISNEEVPWDKTWDDTILPGNFNCFDNSSQASEGQVQQCNWNVQVPSHTGRRVVR